MYRALTTIRKVVNTPVLVKPTFARNLSVFRYGQQLKVSNLNQITKQWNLPLIKQSIRRCTTNPTTATESDERAQVDIPKLVRDKIHKILPTIPQSRIRNFAVIAHIDHGKTTLSNALLRLTNTIGKKDKDAPLDALQVEQERGITVKAHTTSMFFQYNGELYMLNLIDTPGHVDFTYEVSRALSACQGVLLIVDASQGVQAQTMANFFLAIEANLNVIPILNKIDMTNANVPTCLEELKKSFDFLPKDVLLTSAKTGLGIETVLPAIINRIPSPAGDPNKPMKVLLFDSWFDRFRGVICLVEIMDGQIKKGDKIKSHHTQTEYEVQDLGILYPNEVATDTLFTGQVGYVVAGMKSTKEAHIGDTFYNPKQPVEALPGFKPAKPMVFAGIYPLDTNELDKLRDAIQKLTLNDSSVSVSKESSDALGMGFRCGFLGLLHMDVFIQRLEQEYGISVLPTIPTVPYRVVMRNGDEVMVNNPCDYPDNAQDVAEELEPIVNATIIVPLEYYSPITMLCRDKRGIEKDFVTLDEQRVMIKYQLPLAEIVSNFYDRLKELSSGYATFDYDEGGYEHTRLGKVNIMLNGKKVDSLSFLCHRSKTEPLGRGLVAKLKNLIDRQLFSVAIQAVVGAKVIAREDVKAIHRSVISKCYGGDVTRKRKLLEKQKEGKKKMRQIGEVELSQEAFIELVKSDIY